MRVLVLTVELGRSKSLIQLGNLPACFVLESVSPMLSRKAVEATLLISDKPGE